MVSFRSARKIKDYIVRAKPYPLERYVVSRKCSKSRCEVCNNTQSTNLFSSTVTGETCKINHYFNCDSKCLVYLIACRTCNLQYTVQTCDAFWKRWNNYTCCPKYLHEHFLQDGHHGFLNDTQVTLIDKRQASDPTERVFLDENPLNMLPIWFEN